MQLPLDVKAVLDAALGIDQDACEPVAVSVVVDTTAPRDLVAHVRAVFASAALHVRVTLGYLDEGALVAPYDDVVIIVGGVDQHVGERAAQARALGIPTMVVTTLPALVDALARETGFPIPLGDIIAPAVKLDDASITDQARASEASRNAGALAQRIAASLAGRQAGSFAGAMAGAIVGSNPAAFDAEPYMLDEKAAQSLDERMGEWIIDTRRDKCIAMAQAFPFVRRPLALETVHATAAQNAAIGTVAFIPGADLPLMTLNQAKMVLKVAAAYGEPMDVGRAKELVAVVASAFMWRSLARNVATAVPLFGWVIKGGVGYAGTLALGHTALKYFEGGGGITGFAEALGQAGKLAVNTASGAKNLMTSTIVTRKQQG